MTAVGWLPADTDCHIPRRHMEQTQGPVDRMIDGLQARYPQLLLIDPDAIHLSTETASP